MTNRVDIPPGFDSERSNPMTEKNYPTRMHEVLGVELGERFQIKGQTPWYNQNFYVDENGDVRREGWLPPFDRAAVFLINNPERITRRPRLTEEQVDELKAAVKLGLFWLAKDESGTVSYYRDEPRKSGGCQIWFYGNSIQSLRPPQCSDVASLVSWSDPAPLDIVQVLRQNGVEVEVE